MGVSAVPEQIQADFVAPVAPTVEDPRDAFIAELSSQLGGLRAKVAKLIEDPAAEAGRKELARELRWLAGQATTLDLPMVAEQLCTCQAIVQASGVLGVIDAADQEQLAESLDRLDARVKAERDREMTPTSGPMPAVRPLDEVSDGSARRTEVLSIPVVVIGPYEAVGKLKARGVLEGDGLCFAVEHIKQLKSAHLLLRGLAIPPDVIVVDADADGAEALVETLLSDATTDEIPLVLVGSWETPEQASRYVALGVARCLPRPLSPGALRRACAQVAPGLVGERFDAIGETTLDELGARLSEELHQGLCDSAADDFVRRKRVDIGDGSDVLTVLWDAVGRIRELVTVKSAGELRFRNNGPHDALPNASWLSRTTRREQSDRAASINEVRQACAEKSLEGCTIVVAEDDLSTNWFLTGVLREAGATVYDALDGNAALDHAFRHVPDVVLSDVVMPQLDGFALCRAIKRDVLLRGTPVLLLSWKADLLQRVQELGAGADGYLLKEATGASLLQRVREVMYPRRSVAQRLAAGGTVRGRLDSLTPYGLLQLVCRLRPESRVTLRDAVDLFEVELRGGRPVRASQTGGGRTVNGLEALTALVAMSVGRFGVDSASDSAIVSFELEGELEELLGGAIAHVRAAQSLLAGPNLLRVERVVLDDDRMKARLEATPEPARGLLRALSAGASPAELIRTAKTATDLLERVLADAARHSGIAQVLGSNGHDRLPAAIERELSLLDGHADRAALRESHAPLAMAAPLVTAPAVQPIEVAPEPENLAAPVLDDDAYEIEVDLTGSPPEIVRRATLTPAAPLSPSCPLASTAPAPTEPTDASADEDEGEEELEVDELSAEVLISELSARALEVDQRGAEGPEELSGPFGPPPTRELQAHTPILASSVAVASVRTGSTPIAGSVEAHGPRLATLDQGEQPAARDQPALDAEEPHTSTSASLPKATCTAASRGAAEESRATTSTLQPPPEAPPRVSLDTKAAEPIMPRVPGPSSYGPRAHGEQPPANKSWSRFVLPLLFAIIGVSLAIGARWLRQGRATAPPAVPAHPLQPPVIGAPGQPQPAQPAAQPAAVSPASPNEVGSPGDKDHAADLPAPEQAIELPLSKKQRAKLRAGEGLLEIVAGRKDKIYVDGRLLGRGPLRKLRLKADGKTHEIRVKLRGEERVRYVVMKPAVRLRIRVAPPWSR